MQLRQILGADTIRRRHIIHIAGHNDHREIGSQRKEHHIHGIANGIQPEALVVADTGQKLRNYGTGNKTDGNRPACANQKLNQADHHTAQQNAPGLWHFSAHQHIDNASRNCSNGAPKREGHHGSCGGKDAHHYYGKEQNRKNAQCNIVLCLHFVGHADSFCLFTHIDSPFLLLVYN